MPRSYAFPCVAGARSVAKTARLYCAATADSIPIYTAIDAISVYDLRAFFGGRADWFLRRVTRSATLGAAGCACSACSWRRRLPS